MKDNSKLIVAGVLLFILLNSRKAKANTGTGSGTGTGTGTGSGTGTGTTYNSDNGFVSVGGGDGELEQSFLNVNSTYPRGIRNNNPLNVKYVSTNNWLGKIPYAQNTDTNKTFEQFTSYPYGIRCAIYLIRKYMNDYNLLTVNDIIDRWDAGGSNVNDYKTTVSQLTGFSGTQLLTFNFNTVKKLVQAMAKVETGFFAITDSQFNVAWSIL